MSRRSQLGEDFSFNSQFGGIGELESVGTEELDAIVLPGIVGGRDDNSGSEAARAGQEGNSRSSDDACRLDRCTDAGGHNTRRNRGSYPDAGLASIHTEQYSRVQSGASERMCERHANRVDGQRVERRLAGNGADAVRSKELLHVATVLQKPLSVELQQEC